MAIISLTTHSLCAYSKDQKSKNKTEQTSNILTWRWWRRQQRIREVLHASIMNFGHKYTLAFALLFFIFESRRRRRKNEKSSSIYVLYVLALVSRASRTVLCTILFLCSSSSNNASYVLFARAGECVNHKCDTYFTVDVSNRKSVSVCCVNVNASLY